MIAGPLQLQQKPALLVDDLSDNSAKKTNKQTNSDISDSNTARFEVSEFKEIIWRQRHKLEIEVG